MKTTSKLMASAMLLAVTVLSSCTPNNTVPTAYVGKLSTSSGLKPGLIAPGSVYVNTGTGGESLILAEASDYGIEEKQVEIYMPKDNLNLLVDVRGTVSIASEEKNVDIIFSRVAAEDVDGKKVIRLKTVYEIYAQPVIRELMRSVLTKNSIDFVMQNREQVSQELVTAIQNELKSSPIKVIRIGLANVQPPKVIIDSQEAKKRVEIEGEAAEAKKTIDLAAADAALEVARKQQEVDMLKAETQVKVMNKMAEGTSPAYIAQKALDVLEKIAESNNKVVILPMEALSNPSMLVGIMQESLKGSDTLKQPAKPKAAEAQSATATQN